MRLTGIVAVVLLGLVALTGIACGSNNPISHYENKEFSYSIDYPREWEFGNINKNEIGVMPRDTTYNQIQIAAYHTEPLIGTVPESTYANMSAKSLTTFINLVGGSNVNISYNQRASGQWDWTTIFTFKYEGELLSGKFLIKETPSTTYTLACLGNAYWTEGEIVVDSFKVY